MIPENGLFSLKDYLWYNDIISDYTYGLEAYARVKFGRGLNKILKMNNKGIKI